MKLPLDGENENVKILSTFRHADGCEFPRHPATAAAQT
jgi:hypothetical protein